jgi:CheY-like chemotaxis protein
MLMSGTCGVESKLNEGSIFWIELPKTNSIIELVKIDEILLGNDKKNTSDQAVVLYIEDNSSNIDLVTQILLAMRPNVKLITSVYGKDTVALAYKHKPNLILLDLNLPDIHGAEVVELLKNEKQIKDIPVVVVSADAMPAQVSNLLAAGVKQYLTKPFDVSLFLQVLDKYTIT